MKKETLLLFFVIFYPMNAAPIYEKWQSERENKFHKDFLSKAEEIKKLQNKVQEYEKEKKNEGVIKKYPKSSVATAFGIGIVATFAFLIAFHELVGGSFDSQ